jgi:peroxiredoxin
MRIFAILLLCAAALFGGEHTGRRAPGFALPDTKLKMHDLADYRGRVVVLEFMQTDCPHCATFAAVLNQVQQKYGSKVAVLAVANVPHDTPQKLAQYIAGHKITYPVLYDQGQMEYSYLLKGTIENPYVFLIDASGTIRGDWGYGALTKEIFEGKGLFNEIDRLLAGGASGASKPGKK